MSVTAPDAPSLPSRPRAELRLLRWAAIGVAVLCLLPMVAVFLAAFGAGSQTLAHLADTVLWRYLGTTVWLVLVVGAATFAIGTTTAWLVVMCAFPGRRILEVVLVLPLAAPAFVLAYAYTDILDHPGIVQSTLRAVTGWGPRDYWFPEIRSFGGAAAMLTLVLYPYVYLLARAAFAAQSAGTFHAARALGHGPFSAFWRVSLPMARPAISAGVLLAMMETLADFGTVSFFGVQTFATGIYQSWFNFADRAAAAQLALGLLAVALLLAVMERISRGRARYAGRRGEPMGRITLGPRARWAAAVWCFLPVLFGLLVPALSLAVMAQGSEQDLLSPRYLHFLRNSVMLASIAAVLTLMAAIVLGYAQRISPGRATLGAVTIGRLGYAVPGGVIAVGLLVPFAAFDNSLDAFMRATFGVSTGLFFTGSIWLLILAYMVRYLAAAIGAYEGGQEGVNRNLDAAARVLGAGPYKVFARVQLPIMRPALMTGLLIVFVDVMKELPATLIMRPFNFDTLAVQAHRLASDERLEGAAVPSLVLVAVGLVPVILLCRRVRRGER